MEDTMATEESRETEEAYEPSGSLNLNGEAWKNRSNTTYTSLLDKYGAEDLFSGDSMERYREMEEENRAKKEELTEYIFSGSMQTRDEEDDMAERIFSQELRLSRIKDYSRAEEDNSIYFVMAELLFVLVFIYVLIRINAGRKKRRESHAVEINLES